MLTVLKTSDINNNGYLYNYVSELFVLIKHEFNVVNFERDEFKSPAVVFKEPEHISFEDNEHINDYLLDKHLNENCFIIKRDISAEFYHNNKERLIDRNFIIDIYNSILKQPTF